VAAVRIKVQHCAITYGSPRCRRARSAASLHRPERTGTSGGRSWHTCDELKTQAASAAVSECANACASRGKACGVGTWEGGWDRLASAVRVRLPSVQSARLQRSSSDAPSAHPGTGLVGVRRRSCIFSDLQLEHDQLSEIGLHSGLSNRKLSATMKPDLDGRTVLGLQPRHKALSETFREKSSDLAILELDPASSFRCVSSASTALRRAGCTAGAAISAPGKNSGLGSLTVEPFGLQSCGI